MQKGPGGTPPLQACESAERQGRRKFRTSGTSTPIRPPGLLLSHLMRVLAGLWWSWLRMGLRAATLAPRSRSQFTRHCWNVIGLGPARVTPWQRPNNQMFDAHLIESRSRVDKLLLVALCGLLALGATFVFSATMVNSAAAAPWYHQSWVRQIVWYVLGIGAATTLCIADYR